MDPKERKKLEDALRGKGKKTPNVLDIPVGPVKGKKAGGMMKKKGYAAGGLKKTKPTQKGLKKLPSSVRNKMGYMAKGGMTKKKKGYAKGGVMKKKK